MGVDHHNGWLRQAGAGCPVNCTIGQRRKDCHKFKSRKFQDKLAALHCQRDDELMMVTSRGIIIRQAVKAISPQSRSAPGYSAASR